MQPGPDIPIAPVWCAQALAYQLASPVWWNVSRSAVSCMQTIGGPDGCTTARNALVYKLRSPATAVLDLYAALSKHHQHALNERYILFA